MLPRLISTPLFPILFLLAHCASHSILVDGASPESLSESDALSLCKNPSMLTFFPKMLPLLENFSSVISYHVHLSDDPKSSVKLQECLEKVSPILNHLPTFLLQYGSMMILPKAHKMREWIDDTRKVIIDLKQSHRFSDEDKMDIVVRATFVTTHFRQMHFDIMPMDRKGALKMQEEAVVDDREAALAIFDPVSAVRYASKCYLSVLVRHLSEGYHPRADDDCERRVEYEFGKGQKGPENALGRTLTAMRRARSAFSRQSLPEAENSPVAQRILERIGLDRIPSYPLDNHALREANWIAETLIPPSAHNGKKDKVLRDGQLGLIEKVVHLLLSEEMGVAWSHDLATVESITAADVSSTDKRAIDFPWPYRAVPTSLGVAGEMLKVISVQFMDVVFALQPVEMLKERMQRARFVPDSLKTTLSKKVSAARKGVKAYLEAIQGGIVVTQRRSSPILKRMRVFQARTVYVLDLIINNKAFSGGFSEAFGSLEPRAFWQMLALPTVFSARGYASRRVPSLSPISIPSLHSVEEMERMRLEQLYLILIYETVSLRRDLLTPKSKSSVKRGKTV